MHFKNLQVNSAVLKRSVYSLFIAKKMLDDSRVNTHQENLVLYLQKMMKMIFHHMGRQAEMRLRKGIEYFYLFTLIYLLLLSYVAPVVASQVTLKLSRLKLWPPKPELCRLKVLI